MGEKASASAITIVLHAFETRYLSYPILFRQIPHRWGWSVVTLPHRPIYPILPYEYFLTFVICLPIRHHVLLFAFGFLHFDFYPF